MKRLYLDSQNLANEIQAQQLTCGKSALQDVTSSTFTGTFEPSEEVNILAPLLIGAFFKIKRKERKLIKFKTKKTLRLKYSSIMIKYLTTFKKYVIL